MAYLQRIRLHKESDLDDDSTFRYKLPSVGLYTAFELRIECNRHATRTLNTVVYPLESVITKIELLAGGTQVMKSITATQLDALNYWDFKVPNARRYRQEAATGNMSKLFLLGGRGLWDREYGFNLARLPEVYIEYTYDLQEGVADYFKANDHDIEIWGYKWMGDNLPTFGGYFRDRQLAAWQTSAADAIKIIEIPVGNQIRRVALQCKTRAKTLGGAFSEVDLRVNNGEYSPVIIKSMLGHTMAEVSEYGLENEIGGIDYGLAGTITDLPYWFSYYQTLHVDAYGASANTPSVWGLLTSPARFYSDPSTAGETLFTLRGWGFQKCLRIGFDHEADGFDLLDTRGLGSLDLVVTETAGSIDAACFVQDIVLY